MNRSTTAIDERTFRSADLAVMLAFLTNGLLAGSWISRLPAIEQRLGVDHRTFGLVLLGSAIGALVSLVGARSVCRRFGVERVYPVAVTTWALLYAAAVASPSAPLLFAALLAIGLTNGVFAVVSNAAGHRLEASSGRVLLPKYHGMFSVGSLAGALVGARVAGHVGAVPHLTLMALLGAGLAFVASRHLPAAGVVSTTPRSSRTPAAWRASLLAPSSLAVAGAGALALCATLAEGAANNWSALFLNEHRGMGEGAAAAGFAVYAGSMAAGRLLGPRFVRPDNRDRLLRLAGALLAGSIVVLVLVHSPLAALLAMAGWGLGVAVLYPSAMGVAAAATAEPTTGIARASMVGFVGFLVGPPVIGALATRFSLSVGLLAVVAVGAAVVLLAPITRTGVAPAVAPEEPLELAVASS